MGSEGSPSGPFLCKMGPMRNFLLFLLALWIPRFALSIETPSSPPTEKGPEIQGYVLDRPYAPPTWDTGTELGSFWLGSQHYWMGLNAGRHVGECLFVQTDTCQQYLDGLFGIAGRESYTHYMLAPSLRFQYVNFPKRWATHFRILAGTLYSIEPGQTRWMGMAGVGAGLTTVLHDKVDLRIEGRLGVSPLMSWSVVFVSLQFKLDKVVADFAEKLKDFGVGTATTLGKDLGQVIDKAGEATGVKGQGKPSKP